MNIEKQTAVALKISPFSETSRVVSWMTETAGKISTIIKGSQRSKSAFLGQYDLFYTCEILFYRSQRGALHILKECAPLKPRESMRDNWRAVAAASYLSDLTAACCHPDLPHPELFAILDYAMDSLAAGCPAEGIIHFFEMQLLIELGTQPRLDSCLKCRSPVGIGAVYFSCQSGGTICGNCAGSGAGPSDTAEISGDSLAMLRFWRQNSPLTADPMRRGRDLRKAGSILGGLLLHHLDFKGVSRDIAVECASISV